MTSANERCARPDCKSGPDYTRNTEFRVSGYCSCECEDMHELELEIEHLCAERDRLMEENIRLRTDMNELIRLRDLLIATEAELPRCAWCGRSAEGLDQHGRCTPCQRREYAAEIDEAAREERDQDLRWRDGP